MKYKQFPSRNYHVLIYKILKHVHNNPFIYLKQYATKELSFISR